MSFPCLAFRIYQEVGLYPVGHREQERGDAGELQVKLGSRGTAQGAFTPRVRTKAQRRGGPGQRHKRQLPLATVKWSPQRRPARSSLRPPPPGSRLPHSPHPGLLPDVFQHLSLNTARSRSHPPPSPAAQPCSCPWPSGCAVRVPAAPCRLRDSEPSTPGRARFASDAPNRGKLHRRGLHPKAGRGMTTPLLYGPNTRPQRKLRPSPK